jgi:protein-S-isoprenylcysteine O-methyltransferase Ste14
VGGVVYDGYLQLVLRPHAIGLVTLFSFRIPDEERLMTERFDEEYKAYMKRTKRLIPFVY